MKKIHFMNAKILLIVILLVTGISLNAQVVDKETTLTEVMSNIWSEQDEFSQVTTLKKHLKIRMIFTIGFFYT
jgi:hypothetical protein